MRRLRALAVIPMVAGLLLTGSATASAQPAFPGLPGTGSAPFIDYGFTCSAPEINEVSFGTVGQRLQTTESWVILWPEGTQWSMFGQNQDFNIMKCFFHYPHGTVIGAPYTEKGFRCTYPSGQPGGPSQPSASHVFANSLFVVRDTFAILICTGTAQEKLSQTISITRTPVRWS